MPGFKVPQQNIDRCIKLPPTWPAFPIAHPDLCFLDKQSSQPQPSRWFVRMIVSIRHLIKSPSFIAKPIATVICLLKPFSVVDISQPEATRLHQQKTMRCHTFCLLYLIALIQLFSILCYHSSSMRSNHTGLVSFFGALEAGFHLQGSGVKPKRQKLWQGHHLPCLHSSDGPDSIHWVLTVTQYHLAVIHYFRSFPASDK